MLLSNGWQYISAFALQGGCTRPTTHRSTEPTFPPPTESSTWSTGSCCPETTSGAVVSPCLRAAWTAPVCGHWMLSPWPFTSRAGPRKLSHVDFQCISSCGWPNEFGGRSQLSKHSLADAGLKRRLLSAARLSTMRNRVDDLVVRTGGHASHVPSRSV